MWSGTYEMLLWTLWAWTGLEIVTFVGSEVKDPSKSYIKGYITGFTLVMVLYLLNAFIIPWVFNYDFLAAYAYLKSEYSDALSKIMGAYALPDPSVPLVASVAVGNAAVAVLIGLSYFLWYVNTALPVWVGGSEDSSLWLSTECYRRKWLRSRLDGLHQHGLIMSQL